MGFVQMSIIQSVVFRTAWGVFLYVLHLDIVIITSVYTQFLDVFRLIKIFSTKFDFIKNSGQKTPTISKKFEKKSAIKKFIPNTDL